MALPSGTLTIEPLHNGPFVQTLRYAKKYPRNIVWMVMEHIAQALMLNESAPIGYKALSAMISMTEGAGSDDDDR